MSGLLIGSSLLVALLAGMVALFAPCCVSIMLPAFLASTFRTSRGIVAMTLVFGAGVGTVIVPVGLGSAALSSMLVRLHTPLFAAAGLLILAAGAATLTGWRPSMRWLPAAPQTRSGPLGVYALGLFSGVASACCAPVLVGVAVLSGGSGSFPVALAIAITYVIGMIVPLLVISLLWDRRDWSNRSWLGTRSISLRGRRMALGPLLSGIVLTAMGALTIAFAFTGPMATEGWRLTAAAWLQHAAAVTSDALTWLPGWAVLLLLALGGVLLTREIRRARRASSTPVPSAPEPASHASIEGPTHDQ